MPLSLDESIIVRDERQKIDDFHKMYYGSKEFGVEAWGNTYWMGIPVLKCPLDLWLYQEIIAINRPDLIIETGTAHGGSALYLASILDLVGNGEVLTIDIDDKQYGWARPAHPRIKYLTASSVSDEAMAVARSAAAGKRVMVILDSDHRQAHVERELGLYSPLVSVGSYLIVEDTNINGHPVGSNFGPGPMEAVLAFMPHHREFAFDESMRKFFLSFNPIGYWRRVR